MAAGAGAGAPQPLLRRRRRPVDLLLARRRGRQHPALRARLPRRPGDPAGMQLPLDAAHPRRRLRADRPQPRPARQDAVDDRGRRREGAACAPSGTARTRRASSASEIEALRASGHALGEMAVLVRAGFQTREFEERLITVGIPYRVIGGARFYERQEIRDAIAYFRIVVQPRRRPRLRAHRQHAEARPRRRHAAQPCISSPAATACRCRRPRPGWSRPTSSSRRRAARSAGCSPTSAAGASC